MKKEVFFFTLCLFCSCCLSGQKSDTTFHREDALFLYLDCADCDNQYFKTEFTTVNYVSDRSSADVQVLVTSVSTGGGGMEYTLQFIGMRRFSALQDTFAFTLDAYATDDITRAALLHYIELGLVPYLMKTPAKDLISLIIDEGETGYAPELDSDKWRNWIFELNAGTNLSSTKSLKNVNVTAGLDFYKVTPEIKVESYNAFAFSEQKYKLYDGDSLIYSNLSSQQQISSGNLVCISIGDHAGIGGVGVYERDNFRNLNHQLSVGPAIEYNIYPYDEATRKQFRFLYIPYYEYSDYIDSTVHNKIKENRFNHELNIMVTYNAPAFRIDAAASAVSSLTDFSQHEFGCSIFWRRTFEKQRINFNINASFIYSNDQVGLKKETASMEEFLLNKCELESEFSYTIGFSISYRFGSKQDNTVNPRFSF